MLDILIKNGKVYDGSGNPYTLLDIGVKDGKIVKLERHMKHEAKKVIDAKGLAVSPGFIDTHVHSDLLWTKPEIHQIKIKKGVTTELFGQDGISVAPVSNETRPLWQAQLKGLNGDIGEWPWDSVESYLKKIDERKSLTNVSYLVPHGNIRTLVMGFEKRESTVDEQIEMRKLVEKAMEEGAIGFSTGLVYPPNSFCATEELIEICKGVAKYDGCLVVHMRNESFNIMQALDEMIEVSKQSGVRLHLSHFKVIGIRNRESYQDLLEKINEARLQGIEITFDQYPYTAASTVFSAVLPPWVHDGGTEMMLSRLKNPLDREKIKEDFVNNLTFENWVYNCGWENIIISSIGAEELKSFEGKSVKEIADTKNESPDDVAMDLLVAANANVTMVVHWGLEEDVVQLMKSPYHIVGSDSIFGGKPHPRLYGTQPRVLGRYVRELKILTLEEAIHHMTGSPAQLLRLKNRGLIKEGYYADIVIFDPETVSDQATFSDPLQEPIGIEYVLVNGEVSSEENRVDTESLHGKVIQSEVREYITK
ncbi:D-aminoacylase [Sutcliffiella cohnii]|uniref:N-acyl-D-amino-acid deacylase family protein n=1 Tax=Sutcliffiella cohnii TaxID=33932 RepID=UPI002E202345|nr:D-aminoacylase [Sutcliffiella cohnii]